MFGGFQVFVVLLHIFHSLVKRITYGLSIGVAAVGVRPDAVDDLNVQEHLGSLEIFVILSKT